MQYPDEFCANHVSSLLSRPPFCSCCRCCIRKLDNPEKWCDCGYGCRDGVGFSDEKEDADTTAAKAKNEKGAKKAKKSVMSTIVDIKSGSRKDVLSVKIGGRQRTIKVTHVVPEVVKSRPMNAPHHLVREMTNFHAFMEEREKQKNAEIRKEKTVALKKTEDKLKKLDRKKQHASFREQNRQRDKTMRRKSILN